MFAHGPGGVGKSHEVLAELNRLHAIFHVWNSQMTARGLFDALQAYPDAIHIMEDMEQITRDRRAQGVLRSALWAQKQKTDTGLPERLVTWATNRGDERFLFTGGIIMLSNRPLDDCPELRAVATRIACVEHRPTEAETQALMRAVAQGVRLRRPPYRPGGLRALVADYLIEQALALRRSLDMRLLIDAFHDYLQWEDADADPALEGFGRCLGAGSRECSPQKPVATGGRDERLQREREIAREIAGQRPPTGRNGRVCGGKRRASRSRLCTPTRGVAGRLILSSQFSVLSFSRDLCVGSREKPRLDSMNGCRSRASPHHADGKEIREIREILANTSPIFQFLYPSQAVQHPQHFPGAGRSTPMSCGTRQ